MGIFDYTIVKESYIEELERDTDAQHTAIHRKNGLLKKQSTKMQGAKNTLRDFAERSTKLSKQELKNCMLEVAETLDFDKREENRMY